MAIHYYGKYVGGGRKVHKTLTAVKQSAEKHKKEGYAVHWGYKYVGGKKVYVEIWHPNKV